MATKATIKPLNLDTPARCIVERPTMRKAKCRHAHTAWGRRKRRRRRRSVSTARPPASAQFARVVTLVRHALASALACVCAATHYSALPSRAPFLLAYSADLCARSGWLPRTRTARPDHWAFLRQLAHVRARAGGRRVGLACSGLRALLQAARRVAACCCDQLVAIGA